MYDQYNRAINYLRISVTDKCNLRCFYCMPEKGVPLFQHQDILSYEEITEIARFVAKKGVQKIRLTGGEPLIRRDIVTLVRMLAEVQGIQDLSLTTNGVFLDNYAENLADAGLDRVNVSLDTLDPEKYKRITRGGNLEDVLQGIKRADEAGLKPVKINMVLSEIIDEKDKDQLRNYCSSHGYELRFIHQMNLEKGEFTVVEGGAGGDCKYCNRLRLTANGKIKPCLFSNLEYDVREMGIERALNLALENKPLAGSKNESCTFYRMGG